MSNLNLNLYSKEKILTENEIKNAFSYCLRQIDNNLEIFSDKFPSAASVDLMYYPTENTGWTQGFWTGMLWLAYEVTKDKKYRDVAEKQIDSFLHRIEKKIAVNNHDMGFLYSLSCVSAYKLTGNEKAKRAALLAAEHLITRYSDKGRFIQAWGNLDNENERRLITDCLLNIPLLYWASEETGNSKYFEIAKNHFYTSADTVIRKDYSTYHTYFFDVDGNPRKGTTAQGYSDNSAWARGQTWGIYGLILSYTYLKDEKILEKDSHLIDYFLNNLPSDFIPCWDLIFTDDNTQRDSSSAPIAVCGILEFIKHSTINNVYYQNAINQIMSSLISKYTTKGMNSNGILTHGVYNIPRCNGVDECTIWGDYFYMEALVRLMTDWEMYW